MVGTKVPTAYFCEDLLSCKLYLASNMVYNSQVNSVEFDGIFC